MATAMIKAVFFDLYHTLLGYDPPREELQANALRESGIEVNPETLRRPMVVADEYIYQEHSRVPLGRRSREDQMAVWMQYERILLREAGIEADDQLIREQVGKMRQFNLHQVLFDDVLPALNEVRKRGLITGLISNVDQDITSLLDKLELTPLLQVVVTSLDTGFNKPKPEIFQEAVKRAGVQPHEAIYVGDQYQIDVVGANQAGLKGILIDRADYFADVADCPRLQNLRQLSEHLD
ncbi:MAG TPA: HAD-IA family hydrolase [Dehalococcoidia bacterium]|nr:HAD-IA family hydrolase [Dehalococcoidia bacterium]